MSTDTSRRQPRVLLAVLSERTSGKGNEYLSGWLGKAKVVGFRGEADKYGNSTWNLYVSEPRAQDATGSSQLSPWPARDGAEVAAGWRYAASDDGR